MINSRKIDSKESDGETVREDTVTEDEKLGERKRRREREEDEAETWGGEWRVSQRVNGAAKGSECNTDETPSSNEAVLTHPCGGGHARRPITGCWDP